MRIKNIKIENYRGILNEEIEFNENVNVFIGGNGAGKTTLLEAIVASILKITFNVIGSLAYKSNLISTNDINYESNYSSILLNLEIPVPSNINPRPLSKNAKYKIPLFVKTGVLEETEVEKFHTAKYSEYINEYRKQIEHGVFDLPIIKYYPVNRGAIKYNNKPTSSVYLNARVETWTNIIQNDISFSKFIKWFSEHEIQELRLQRDAGNFNKKSKRINNVRIAIQSAFKKLNGKEYLIKSEEIRKNGTNNLIPTIALQEKESKIKEKLDNKSSGEKAIISLIADIAYNLSIAHDFSSNEDFLKGSGIVLIDEIEAHLHPTWQRKIIPLLIELFPNIQFFITTHSPQVIASVNSQDVFICDDFKFRKIDFKSKGMDSNTLLTTFFDTKERPTTYAKLIAEFRDMMDANADIDELERRIQEIEALNQDDEGEDQSQLIEELRLELAAHKFDLEHEIN